MKTMNAFVRVGRDVALTVAIPKHSAGLFPLIEVFELRSCSAMAHSFGILMLPSRKSLVAVCSTSNGFSMPKYVFTRS